MSVHLETPSDDAHCQQTAGYKINSQIITFLGTNDKTDKEIRKTTHLKIASSGTKYIKLQPSK